MEKFDVVIIGGGPAGISLAYSLVKRNISCCVIDKAIFPRKKLCGGLVTQKTIDVFEKIYGDTNLKYKIETKDVGIYYDFQCLNRVQADLSFYLVDRFDFDFDLVLRYKAKNGVMYEGMKVQKILSDSNVVQLSNGKAIEYNYLVGADGANSIVRKQIDANYQPDGLCLEVNRRCEINDKEIQLHFGVLNKGYGWVFPKNDVETIGYGGVKKNNKNIVNGFNEYLRKLNISQDETIEGALLSFGTYVEKPYKNNMFLIGDAMGITDPVTGEGLYYSLLSAYVLAKSIQLKSLQAIQSNYYAEVKKMQKNVKKIIKMRNFFFRPLIMKKAMNIFKNHPNVIKFTCDNAISYYRIPFIKLPLEYYRMKKGKK